MVQFDAWASSAVADMAARPCLSTTVPQRERVEEGERGKGRRKGAGVATDWRSPRVSGTGTGKGVAGWLAVW
jgi:hypothetical protein